MNKIGKEDVYKLGIVLILFAIICIFVFLFLGKKEELVENNNQFTDVSNYNIFFFVNNNVNNYIDYVIQRNTEAVFSFFENDFKIREGINQNIVFNKIPSYNDGDFYKAFITKSYTLNDGFEIYYTEGQIVNEGYETTTIVQPLVRFLLYVDFKNMTTSIALLNSPFEEEQFVAEVDKNKEISLNVYNKIEQIEIIDYTRICSMYLSDFISRIDGDLSSVYSLVTNFDTLEKFDDFIKQNNITGDIQSCSQTMNEDGKRVYKIKDKNNYNYTFVEESILNYRVSLVK